MNSTTATTIYRANNNNNLTIRSAEGNKYDRKWEKMYQRLVAYKKEHNDTNVTRKYKEDPQLGSWVHTQRIAYKANKISAERKRLLDSVGFLMGFSTTSNAKLMEMYQRLVAYKREHKDTNVPRSYKEDLQLGSWVHTQRTAYKANKISAECKSILDYIDFVWDWKGLPGTSTATWEEMYERLVAYKKEHNDTNVRQRYKKDPQLGIWVNNQRARKKNMTKERKRLLNSIVFVWDARNTKY